MLKQHHNFSGIKGLHANLMLGIIIALITSLSLTNSTAQEVTDQKEYNIKAAYLYNFIRFTKWPEPKTATDTKPIVIGILGKSPFSKNAFETVSDQIIPGKDRKLVIKHLGRFKPNIDIQQCDIIFISASEKSKIKRIIKHIGNSPIMTVSETPEFIDDGGMINLIVVNKKIRWEMNNDAIKKSSLVVNSQLYRSAVRVIYNEG